LECSLIILYLYVSCTFIFYIPSYICIYRVHLSSIYHLMFVYIVYIYHVYHLTLVCIYTFIIYIQSYVCMYRVHLSSIYHHVYICHMYASMLILICVCVKSFAVMFLIFSLPLCSLLFRP